MIDITNKEDCCGCSACLNICPKSCILMKEDEEGFKYPLIDTKLCISCEMCTKVCPIINNKQEVENKKQKGYIVANNDQLILKQSTSGGFFTPLAEYVIDHNGVVFGVEMDGDFNVKHVGVKEKSNICRFRNSKYVQSDIGNVYKEVEDYLKKEVMVCFSGTPCQIEGLRHYLNKDYSNLILVDVVCRAVPSPGVWKRYVRYLINRYGEIESIRFRDKKLGYQYSTMEIVFKNGRILRNGLESDQWLRMFFSGMIIRPSCANCKFRKKYRYSDFTIWDCFNISDISDKFNEKLGATRILVHTDKGMNILNSIKSNLLMQEINPETLTDGMKELSVSPQINSMRSSFFYDYNNLTFEKLLRKYYPMSVIVICKKTGRRVLNKLGVDIIVKKIKRKIRN